MFTLKYLYYSSSEQYGIDLQWYDKTHCTSTCVGYEYNTIL